MKMKRLSIFVMVVLAFCVGTTSAFGQNEKKALKNADRHLGFDEYKQAIPYLKEAVGYNPKNALSQYLLGKCLFINYEKTQAVKHFEAAYKLNKEVDSELSLYYARCLHYKLRFEEAITQYQRALTKIKSKDAAYREVQIAIEHCKYGMKAIEDPVNAKIVNVGPPINTQYAEHSPVINADESVLIYTTIYPSNTGCKGDPMCPLEDIYMTEKVGEKWGKPEPIKSVNTSNHDATIGLSPDGQKLFIYKNPPGGGDIFTSDLEGRNWSKPSSIGSPINSKYWEEVVSIAPDNKTIFFTSERPGGRGKSDIYMAKITEEGEWGEPVNLKELNSPYEERSPFIHPNGVELYFSTDGRPDCIGGFDIFRSVLQEDGSWSTPENIGYPINTPDDDIYFVLSADQKTGYYASAKEGGYGNKDIYKIVMPEEEEVVAVVEDTLKPAPVVKNALTILKGVIRDAKTQKPVEASLQVIDNEKDVVVANFNSNSATGKYLVTLPSGKNYGIRVESPDYLFKSVNVNIPKSEGFQEIIKDVDLDKIEIGKAIVLNNIFYDYDKATLRPESKAELERLHQFMSDNPSVKVEIGGHTDSDGSDSYNQDLSERRSQSVVKYLQDKGIPINRMVAKGYGEKVPMVANDSPENKQKNRRTELKILEK